MRLPPDARTRTQWGRAGSFSISAVQNHVAAARATAAESYVPPAHAWRSVRRRLRPRTHRGVRRGARRAAASGSMRVGPDPPTTIPFPPHKRRPPFPSLLHSSLTPRGTPRRAAKNRPAFLATPDLYKRAPRHGTPPRNQNRAPHWLAHTGRPPPAPLAKPPSPRFPRAAQSHSSSVQFAAGGRDTHTRHAT